MVGDQPEDEECARRAGVKFMRADQWRAGANEGNG
jgi:phosphoglycolate phosphatase-like HAD superfamily hydrolase